MTYLALAAAAFVATMITAVLTWRDGLHRFPADFTVGLVAGFAAALAGLALVGRLQRRIAAPLMALKGAMQTVQETHDYAEVVSVEAHGEVAEVVARFNEMLNEIRVRDSALGEIVSELERNIADIVDEQEQALAQRPPAPLVSRASPAPPPPLGFEIRAPILGVQALAEKLAAGDLAPKELRLAEVIARAGASLAATVEDLVELSRPDAPGELELKAAPVDLAELIEDVVFLFWAPAQARGLDLAAHIDPTTPARIEADPMRLRQAISILVSIAIDLTESGAILAQAAPTGEALRIVVRYSAAAPAADTFRDGGADPGPAFGERLAVGRRLAAAMGGALMLKAEEGKSSALMLDLPLKPLGPPAAWPTLDSSATLKLAGAATRISVQRYLRASGVTLAAAGSDEPAVGVLIADPIALKGGERSPLPTICLAEDDDPALKLVLGAGLTDLTLALPLRRSDLAAAIARLADNASLAPAAPAEAEKAASPAVAGASTAADLLDPQVTGELARLVASGKGDFVAKVRRLYRENAPEAVKALIDASTNRDCEGVARAAHALKSMSLNMGARLVAETASRLEAQARELGVVNVDQAQILHRQLLATLDVLEGYPPEFRATGPEGAAPDEEALLSDLSESIDNDQLALVYQPQFDREGETITGIETLVRWNHATRGFVSPAFFIPLAERYGMIGRVTRWVLARAMNETRDLGEFTLSFNASAVEFADPAFVDELAVLIARCGFDPKRLEIEVTETAVLAEEDAVRRNMARLHELGMKIALDDFGVGYSSLSHLRLFPFDKLKIDRAFVTSCAENVQSATLVHAVVSIGRALGMTVVAEGVETEAQRKFLRVAGVDAMQGYLFAKPEPVAALQARLQTMKTPEALSA